MSLWSWFLNKCVLIFNYFLIKYKGYRFNQDAKNCTEQKINRQTLFNILKQNKNTKFLIDQYKKSNLNKDENIESLEDFK